ncbi:MAG: 50S ribosomal protein L6 [Deltaproteobacteria bacterium]|nr:50S ribosomal protein L6 [Deltaproteobacteria bacterium]
MSRVGKRPILLPEGVKVDIDQGRVKVKGPKGALERPLVPKVKLDSDGRTVTVKAVDQSRQARAFNGLFRTLVNNMVVGVSAGFSRRLELVGVGYRAELSGRTINLALGYSNPVRFELPQGIEAEVDRQKITLTGIDKELVGQTAARIRTIRPPEPYKSKGVKYAEEKIRRKVGKAGAK